MADAEIRGHLLTVFHRLRHSNGGWVPTSEVNLAGMEAMDRQVIDMICQHLSEAGLIDWRPLRGAEEGSSVGMARIRGHGVDVIEGKASPSINVTFPNQGRPSAGVGAEGVAGEFVQSSNVGVSGRGVAGNIIPDAQSWEVAAQIAARQRGLTAATQAFDGAPVAPAIPDQSEQSIPTLVNASVSIETRVDRATIPIVPTLYPGEPASGAIIVQNFITVDVGGKEFREFGEKVIELVDQLQRSNEISGEVREKLLAEMAAGMAILRSPKPDPKLIDLLLRRPLAYVADKAVGTVVSTLAATALMALLKMTGLL